MRDLKKEVYYDKDDNILNMLDGNDKIINIISLGIIRLHYKNNKNHYNDDRICNYNKNNISNNGLNNNSDSNFNSNLNNNFNNSSNNTANNSRHLFEK